MEWHITREGEKAVVQVWRPDDKAGLYKVWLRGREGRYLLGALLPEGDRLYLRRSVSIEQLRRCGAWPAVGVEGQLVFSSGTKPPAAIPFRDPLLRQCVRALGEHRLQHTKDGWKLQVPYRPDAPFPMVPLFCFACPEGAWLTFFLSGGCHPVYFSAAGKK